MFTFHARRSLLAIAFSAVIACMGCKSDSSKGTDAAVRIEPIGSSCTKDSDCGPSPLYCMVDHPGGYCTRDCTTDADCPSEAICLNDGMKGECHAKCSGHSECLSGYECTSASKNGAAKTSHSYCDVSDVGDAGGAGAH